MRDLFFQTLNGVERDGFVKSVAQYRVPCDSAAASGSIAFSPVPDLNNTMLVYMGEQNNDGAAALSSLVVSQYHLYATANATHLIANKGGAYGAGKTYTVGIAVIEFYPGVIRFRQTGTITLAAGSGTAALSPGVNINKAVASCLGFNPSTALTNADFIELSQIDVRLTNSTTVTAAVAAGSVVGVMGYQVVEFY